MPKWDVDFNCRLNLQDQEIVGGEGGGWRSHSHIPLPPGLQAMIDRLTSFARSEVTGIGGRAEQSEVERSFRQAQENMSYRHRVSAPNRRSERRKVMRFVAKTLAKTRTGP
jgi:hypothetical protein